MSLASKASLILPSVGSFMLYRLAFSVTTDGYLRVTGCAKGTPRLSAIHHSDAFTALVSVAGLAQFLTLRILEAARQAWIEPGIDVCCEAVELNQRQIEVLCLQPGQNKIA
jgi:hypothetical protein